jgi:hypothetical protein
MAAACTHPAFAADHHGDGFVDDFDFGHGLFLGLDQSAARVFGRVAKQMAFQLCRYDVQLMLRRVMSDST